ncbi:MAG: hypothetical protein JNK11_06015 [Alphaproteobacteria bacterium]|nr:hypothetical protein [Alphaproteobacteria bacterium]
MSALPAIPVVVLGPAGYPGLVDAFPERVGAILAAGRRDYTPFGLALGDRMSRRWVAGKGARGVGAYAGEIAAVAARMEALLGARHGAHLLNLSYEWGCTAGADAGGAVPRLHRTLDWTLPGLGRALVAAAVPQGPMAPAGPYLNLTWPGFVGAVQGLAPGRFALSLNQAPVPNVTVLGRRIGRVADWLAGKLRVLRSTATPPLLLMRRVLEQAPDFAAARAMLAHGEITMPCFVTLVGCRAGEAVVIERGAGLQGDRAVTHQAGADGRVCVSNHWLSEGIPGVTQSLNSLERLAAMRTFLGQGAGAAPGSRPLGGFGWLAPPILNSLTRLAFEAEPATGRIVVRAFEAAPDGTAAMPVTEILRWEAGAA